MRKILLLLPLLFWSCEDKQNCEDCSLATHFSSTGNIITYIPKYTSLDENLFEIRNDANCYVNVYDNNQVFGTTKQNLILNSSLNQQSVVTLPPGCSLFIVKPEPFYNDQGNHYVDNHISVSGTPKDFMPNFETGCEFNQPDFCGPGHGLVNENLYTIRD